MNRPTLAINTDGHPAYLPEYSDIGFVPTFQNTQTNHPPEHVTTAEPVYFQGQNRSSEPAMKSFQFPRTTVSFTHAMVTPGHVEYSENGFRFTADGQPFLWTNPDTRNPIQDQTRPPLTTEFQRPLSSLVYNNAFPPPSCVAPSEVSASNPLTTCLNHLGTREAIETGPHPEARPRESDSGFYNPFWNQNSDRCNCRSLEGNKTGSVAPNSPLVTLPVLPKQATKVEEPSTTRMTVSLSPSIIRRNHSIPFGNSSTRVDELPPARILPHTSHGFPNGPQGSQNVLLRKSSLASPSGLLASSQGFAYKYPLSQPDAVYAGKRRYLQSAATSTIGDTGGQIQPQLELAHQGNQFQTYPSEIYGPAQSPAQPFAYDGSALSVASQPHAQGFHMQPSDQQGHGDQPQGAHAQGFHFPSAPPGVTAPQHYLQQPLWEPNAFEPLNANYLQHQSVLQAHSATQPFASNSSVTTGTHSRVDPRAVTSQSTVESQIILSSHADRMPNSLQHAGPQLVDSDLHTARPTEHRAADVNEWGITRIGATMAPSLAPSYVLPVRPQSTGQPGNTLAYRPLPKERNSNTLKAVSPTGAQVRAQTLLNTHSVDRCMPQQMASQGNDPASLSVIQSMPTIWSDGRQAAKQQQQENTPNLSGKKVKSRKRAATSSGDNLNGKQRKLKGTAHAYSGESIKTSCRADEPSTLSQSGQSRCVNGLNESAQQGALAAVESGLEIPMPLVSNPSSAAEPQLAQALQYTWEQPTRPRGSTAPPSTRMCDSISTHGYDLRSGPRSARLAVHASDVIGEDDSDDNGSSFCDHGTSEE